MAATRKPRPSRSKAAIAARKAAREAADAAVRHLTPTTTPEDTMTEPQETTTTDTEDFNQDPDPVETELLATWAPDEMREEMAGLLAEHPAPEDDDVTEYVDLPDVTEADTEETELTTALEKADADEPLTDAECAALDAAKAAAQPWIDKGNSVVVRYGTRAARKEQQQAAKGATLTVVKTGTKATGKAKAVKFPRGVPTGLTCSATVECTEHTTYTNEDPHCRKPGCPNFIDVCVTHVRPKALAKLQAAAAAETKVS